MKYTCPICKQGFEKANKNRCPHCEALLQPKRNYAGGKLQNWYYEVAIPVGSVERETTSSSASLKDIRQVMIETEAERVDITIVHESPEKVSTSKYPVRLTEPGQVPVVIQAGDNEFDVYFQHMMYSGMVYCPKCQSPAFQNMQLFGDLEHWCAERFDGKSCKARTVYHFNDPVGVEVN